MELITNQADADNRNSYWSIYFILTIIYAALFARDAMGIGINKWLFVGLAMVCIIFIADIPKTIIFLFAIMPIYVGLPGNYITIIFLTKLILNYLKHPQNYAFRTRMTLAAFGMIVVLLGQDFLLGYLAIYNLIGAAEVLILVFLFAYQGKVDWNECIFVYIVSVAFLGIVVLANNLQSYTISQLMNNATRLGTAQLTEMTLKIDPNYNGYFVMTAVSCGWIMLSSSLNRIKRMVMIVSMIVSVGIAFIGLSRTFVLMLAIWVAFLCVLQRKKSKVLALVGIMIIALVIFFSINGAVYDAIIGRFSASDISGGNGRIELLTKWIKSWGENFFTILFGCGLFVVNAHCMPVQFFAGIGIVGSLLVLIFAKDISRQPRLLYGYMEAEAYIPMLVTFLYACTVPVAQSLTFMFPTVVVVVILFVFGEKKETNY